MCGIVGFVANSLKNVRVDAAVEALHHRGPDFGDSITENVGSHEVFLGHKRLSIIDLSDEGNQPMHDGEVSIVFNGEVYNFRELKAAHLSDQEFHSSSDTEVVLKLYRKFGFSFVSHLNGDFAIAILDRGRKELVCVRDRIGVKPFYIYEKDGLFGFASEIKSFRGARA